MFKKTAILVLFVVLNLSESFSQDIQFSQFYAANLYLNPAFAGSAHKKRIALHQRLQWPYLDAKYITSKVSFDTYWHKYNSGFGLVFVQDWQGSNDLRSTEVDLQYSYQLFLSESIAFRAGLQLGLFSRSFNYANQLFPDQLDNNGPTGSLSFDSHNNPSRQFADVSSGGVLYSEKFWAGISAHHMNTPNQSFLGEVSRLPVKYTFVGGYKFFLGQSERRKSTIRQEHLERSITPTIHYKFQGKNDQVDYGLYAAYEHYLAGVWYRGLPLIKDYDKALRNNESMVVILGYKIQTWVFSYSYDFTVSRLQRVRTGGSHELHISYTHDSSPKRRRPLKRLPCPDF